MSIFTFFFFLLIRQVLVDSHDALRRATVSTHKLIQNVHALYIDQSPCKTRRPVHRQLGQMKYRPSYFLLYKVSDATK